MTGKLKEFGITALVNGSIDLPTYTDVQNNSTNKLFQCYVGLVGNTGTLSNLFVDGHYRITSSNPKDNNTVNFLIVGE